MNPAAFRWKAILPLCFLFFSHSLLVAQTTQTQWVRGRVVDDVTRFPIEDATIAVLGTGLPSARSDKDGYFKLNIPLGRYSLLVTHTGYETGTAADVLVTAGKEEQLVIPLTEKTTVLEAVVVQAKSGQAMNNEMVAVSGTVFNPADTRRFAGSIGDPARMISAMAGVANASDGRNDIVVRGNSPLGLLWQVEGVTIANPNHYGSLASTGGPVSILNANSLAKSDFIAGAFPAQYGNALGGVFDLRLRNGNSEKTEAVGEIGFAGFEAGIEGPFSRRSKASYLVNYRYSTVGLLQAVGFNVGTGSSIPEYQDINFKIHIPLSAKNTLSAWGMGGPSKIDFLGNEADTTKNQNLYGAENTNIFSRFFTGIAGLNLETHFGRKTFGKLSIGINRATEKGLADSISEQTREAFRTGESRFKTSRYEVAYTLAHKFSARSSLLSGVTATAFQYQLFDKRIYGNYESETIQIDENTNTALLQAFSQLKHRFTERLTFTAGLHYQQLTLNGSRAVEPRASLQYDLPGRQTISVAYGDHAQMQSPVVYFKRSYINGQPVYTNRQLGFTRSRQMVLSYANQLASSLRLRAEAYYQKLSHVPVTRYPSGFSMLNEGAGFGILLKDSLVNKGTGANYGVDLTLEKSFSRYYYFLITGSLFQSRYKGSDGVERNTTFNNNYIANILTGKDFRLEGDQHIFSVSLRMTVMGGRYVSPVDAAASASGRGTTYDEDRNPYSIKQAPYYRADLKFGGRRNFKRSTLEGGVDLRNITNRQNLFVQLYDRKTQKVVNQYQPGILVVPYFRFTF
ncbi:TonB-dependent receptor [Niabella drilacis]|uniref:TonB-dependent Receptor Plug Domain n=1 Tax=Niabella drilacis (strain DSM 25811 / CCM 8410 / CCUG 62505 / LMG 26954 / E90) TaxID=1285928 RepID=A0A1G7BR28_NIADE|nr:TonB-dependent receptor [Niabella drilacis]SDE29529.1 TonB-dependent Receptor Plug Domain [Niabella drilacis]